MDEFMYDVSSLSIAAILLISMALAIEAGFRVGARRHAAQSEASRGHINAVQASLLGVLALLLGFTFSLSLQRFDSRSEAAVDEVNAIGTAFLRADLLPAPARDEVRALLRSYLNLRVQAGEIALDHETDREARIVESNRLQGALWQHGREAAERSDDAVLAALFLQSVNDMIDAFGRRDAALKRHVPELVLMLLYGTFLMAGVILGYAAGISGHRPSLVTYVLVALIVVLVFIIVDLDRPRRGLIRVSHASMIELQETIGRPGG
jgi:hypothetical protein